MLSDVTTYQWSALVLGGLGFLVTWTAMVINTTRAVARIKDDVTMQMDHEIDRLAKRMDEATTKRDAEILDVRSSMAKVELFGRDNFVLKRDYLDGLQDVKSMLIRTTDDIKHDIRSLSEQITKMLNRRQED
jgi:hypothetical protein